MGTDIKEELKNLIERLKGFNNDPKVVNQRVRAIIVTKLEEAELWLSRLTPTPKGLDKK